jgi:hypothetical protein
MGFTLPSKSTENAVVILRGVAVPLASDVGGAFISDAARNRERLFSDQRLIEKYGLTMRDWEEIARNQTFRLAVDAEHERRTFNGDAAREAAAKFFTNAPQVLDTILQDQHASPRHRIEAAKELRATANVGAEKAGDDADRFVITINLSGDRKLDAPEKLVIDKQIRPLTSAEAQEQFDAE